MQRKIITTADGSKTIQIIDWDEQYHSVNGAVQESLHVFINAGLRYFCQLYCHTERSQSTSEESISKISILEIGFGTGLNAYVTLLEAEKIKIPIHYVGVEAYPVKPEEIAVLNYPEIILGKKDETYNSLHTSIWEKLQQISPNFLLTKRKQFFNEIKDQSAYNIIYFDAFGARFQPELWTEDMFKIMYNALKPNGVLVTYSAKGSVRRAMQSVGFTVERILGPPGKREMLRATKNGS